MERTGPNTTTDTMSLFNIGRAEDPVIVIPSKEEKINSIVNKLTASKTIDKFSCQAVAMLVELEHNINCSAEEVYELLHPTVYDDRQDLAIHLKNITS